MLCYAVLCCAMLCILNIKTKTNKLKTIKKQLCFYFFCVCSIQLTFHIHLQSTQVTPGHLGAAAASKAQAAPWEEAPTSCRRCPGKMGQKRSGVGESIIDDICHRVIIYNIIQLYDINICLICNNM